MSHAFPHMRNREGHFDDQAFGEEALSEFFTWSKNDISIADIQTKVVKEVTFSIAHMRKCMAHRYSFLSHHIC